jgi:hypothetical protein
MKPEVNKAIKELECQFDKSSISVREDDQGGAYVIIDPVSLSGKLTPEQTWIGFHLPSLYPYADIYPVFMGAEVKRTDGVAFQAPVTTNHNFEKRAAIQISRRNGTAQNGQQKAVSKILKILDFMEKLQ